MKVVRAGSPDFDNLWQKLFLDSEFQYPLYQPYNIKYYEALFQERRFEDCSFVVEEQGVPLAGLRMSVNTAPDGTNQLSGFGLPISFLEQRFVPTVQFRGARKFIRSELDNILHNPSLTSIIFQDYLQDGNLSFLGEYLLQKGARATLYFTQIIDLREPEATLYGQIRKSYKSLINWGKKNLHLKVIEGQTVDPDDVNRFRELHLHAAGRETRSRLTWHRQYEMVRAGEAFVVTGELDGELVTAALFPCSSRYCFYGVSASKRELFDKPMSHAVIWCALLHAKEHGCIFFELPELRYPEQGPPLPTEKELSISTFKRGFGGETHIRLNMKWEHKEDFFQQVIPSRE
jgi:hypothetical protein